MSSNKQYKTLTSAWRQFLQRLLISNVNITFKLLSSRKLEKSNDASYEMTSLKIKQK